jgi:hypothetical protein
MKISILLITLVFSVLTLAAQPEAKKSKSELKAELKRAKAEAIREIVKSKNFIFKAEMVNPGNSRPKSLTTEFGIEVRNDTVFSYMPYFGNIYSRDYTTQKNSVMGFIQPIESFATKRTKKGYLVEIRLTNIHDVIDMNFHISLDGLTSVSASSINWQSIAYTGEILIPANSSEAETEQQKK